MIARQYAESALERARLDQKNRADGCPDCFGEHWLVNSAGETIGKCTHPYLLAS